MKIFSCLLAAFFGFLAGAALGVYFIVKRVSRRMTEKIGLPDVGDGERAAEVEAVVLAHKKQFRRSMRGSVFFKTIGAGKKRRPEVGYYAMVREIAAIFNPSSKSPVFELSEREVFAFAHTVTRRLTEILKELDVPFLSSLNLSSLLSAAGAATTVARKKWIAPASKVLGVISRIVNLVNPFYWGKKVVSAEISGLLYREIVEASVSVVGREFAALYASSSASREEDNAEDSVL
ncbi:MAG: hypothetical protein SOT34_00825 [Candidatus Borkfalkiaceae bacterium]|nr:hypothetical protein [Christensenellaceae bacterium]